MPRVFDERVGYFTASQMDYGRDNEHKAPERHYITRWRLEKKDPSANHCSKDDVPVESHRG